MFTGREVELGRLQHMWQQVQQEAQPHLVTIIGEPGIGKSRLAAEFERWLPADVSTWHGRCLPYGEALGYWALAAVLKEAAGIVAEDEAEAARAKLGAAVAAVMAPEGDPEDVARHLALLSGMDVEADRLAGDGDQRILHSSARQFLEAAARRHPLCLVFDDIQWADDSMLDLIEAVAAHVRHTRLMVVTLARPELADKRTAWGRGVQSFTSLPLGALNVADVSMLMLTLARARGLSPAHVAELTAQVSQSAGGNPLYVEEMVAMLAEGKGATAELPSLIKVLIAARLDTLPAVERLSIQLASIFGKVFWEGGLHALDTGHRTAERLESLVQKDLLRTPAVSQFQGDREYSFKHDLIRDVAYDRLPKAERRALHGRAADWLESAAGEKVETYLDQLAHHAVQAGQQKRAIGYLIRAAEKASRAAAYRQAAALFGQAIEIAEELGQRDLATDLHARRGHALVSVNQWPEARHELDAALAGLTPEQPGPRALVLIDRATVSFWTADIPSLRRCSAEAMTLAEAVNRDDIRAGALAALTLAYSSDGNLESVASLTDQSVELAGETPIAAVTFGAAISSLNLVWLARFDEAAGRARQALEIARKANDTQFTAYAMPHIGLALGGQGKYAEAEEVFAEAIQYSRQFEIWSMMARALVMSSSYHYEVYDFAGHQAVVQEGHELARANNVGNAIVSGHIDLLFNHVARGDVSGAEAILSAVSETVANAAGNHGWLWRLRLAQAEAELTLARGDWENALRLADASISHSEPRGRVKYHMFGLGTRASALVALGRKREAIAAAKQGVDIIRPVQSPALFVRAAASLLSLEGDDAVLAEAQQAVARVSAALSNEGMRQSFEAAEPVQLILTL